MGATKLSIRRRIIELAKAAMNWIISSYATLTFSGLGSVAQALLLRNTQSGKRGLHLIVRLAGKEV